MNPLVIGLIVLGIVLFVAIVIAFACHRSDRRGSGADSVGIVGGIFEGLGDALGNCDFSGFGD